MLNILFYTLTAITITIVLINIVIAKQNKIEVDYRRKYEESCRIIVLTLVALMIIYAMIDNRENYIQNIETKLNIYEQEYNERGNIYERF